ncbi:MAG: ATP-binding cassette domain-containing protein [Kiritimatiellae bacterium]|nr:ATP-binding cassette domain-containing protein [Kiritimatiellia bacterium]
MNDVLSLQDVTFSYHPESTILDGITMSVQDCESVALIGANGAGKSTLLKLLVGLLTAQRGTVTVDGLTMCRNNLSRIRRAAGYVFQDAESQLFLANVREDVAFGPRNEGLPEPEVASRVSDALESVGITDLADRQVYKLSGGQKRLASIATVLALRPKVLLLDEPTLALDPRNRRNVIRVLNGLKCAKLIATHDLDFVLDACSRVIVLSGGKLAANGSPDQILGDRELLERHGLELPLSRRS